MGRNSTIMLSSSVCFSTPLTPKSNKKVAGCNSLSKFKERMSRDVQPPFFVSTLHSNILYSIYQRIRLPGGFDSWQKTEILVAVLKLR